MEHRIEKRGPIRIVGVQEVVMREPDFFQRIWSEGFNPMSDIVMPLSVDCALYGVTHMVDGETYYLAGVAVDEDVPVPQDCVAVTIPAATYVVVSCTMAEIGRTYHAIYADLLPQLNLQHDLQSADFERYPPSPTSSDRLDVWVSVKR